MVTLELVLRTVLSASSGLRRNLGCLKKMEFQIPSGTTKWITLKQRDLATQINGRGACFKLIHDSDPRQLGLRFGTINLNRIKGRPLEVITTEMKARDIDIL